MNEHFDPFGEVFLDRTFGYAHPGGDVALRQAFDTPKHEGCTDPGGHCVDCGHHFFQFLTIHRNSFRREPVMHSVSLLQSLERLERHDPRSPGVLQHHGLSCAEQVGFGIDQVVQARPGGEDRISLLHDIVYFTGIQTTPAQPTSEFCLMRQNMKREPTGAILRNLKRERSV